MTGVAYATSAEMAGELGPFPGYARNREHMLRVIRNHRRAAHGHRRLRRPERPRRRRSTTRTAPTRRLSTLAKSAWDEALRLGEAARLPQRPDHRDRPHRHHRPRHGLRHHRHRARLRPGEVQEARRRRLLQDHQPVGPRRPRRRSATPPSEVAEIVAHAVGHGSLGQRARRSTTPRSSATASARREIEKIEAALPSAFDITLRLQPVDPRRGVLHRAPSASPRRS